MVDQRLPRPFPALQHSQHAGCSGRHRNLDSFRRNVTVIKKQTPIGNAAAEMLFEKRRQIDQLNVMPADLFADGVLHYRVRPRNDRFR